MYYYKHSITDYKADTSHLSLLEHGVYRQLLDWYYLDETPIPAKSEMVFRRLCARTDDEKTAVMLVLEEFFSCTESGYVHARCDRELAQYKVKQHTAQSNGKQGGRPKKTESVSDRVPTENQEDNQLKPTDKGNHKPLTNNQNPLTNPDGLVVASSADDQIAEQIADAKTSTVPNCPQQALLDLYAECLPELPQPRAWEGQAADALRTRWRWVLTATKRGSGERYATTAAEGVEWFRRFFGYVAGSDFLMGRKADWQADLRWLVKAANFDKVLSGAYENGRAAA